MTADNEQAEREAAVDNAREYIISTYGALFYLDYAEETVMEFDRLARAAGRAEVAASEGYHEMLARAMTAGMRIEELEGALRDILDNVHYVKDEDGNWHSYYDDKPYAAAATEAARALLRR